MYGRGVSGPNRLLTPESATNRGSVKRRGPRHTPSGQENETGEPKSCPESYIFRRGGLLKSDCLRMAMSFSSNSVLTRSSEKKGGFSAF